MKLELRGIRVSAQMSEETHAYTAIVYADGRLVCRVSNHGTGGSDDQHWTVGHEIQQAVEAAAKAERPARWGMEFNAPDLPFDLECWCGERVNDHLVAADYRRAIRSKVLYADAGRVMEMRWKGVRTIGAAQLDYARRTLRPGAVILNTLPEADAIALFRQQPARA